MASCVVERLGPAGPIDRLIAYAARVTFPKRRDKDPAPLLAALMRNGHWSPFDMVSVLFEVSGISRTCSRQLIRHQSIKVQESSQRWATLQDREFVRQPAVVPKEGDKHETLLHEDEDVRLWFERAQEALWQRALVCYDEALSKGLHPEAARAFLPEGLTPTRVCLNGTVRSWIHFLVQRLHPHAQFEVRRVALDIALWLEHDAPFTMRAAYEVYPALSDYRDFMLSQIVD